MSVNQTVRILLGHAVTVAAHPQNADGQDVPVSNANYVFTNDGVAHLSVNESDPLQFTLIGVSAGHTTLTLQANDDPSDPNDVVVGHIDIEVAAEAAGITFDVSDQFAVEFDASRSWAAGVAATATGAATALDVTGSTATTTDSVAQQDINTSAVAESEASDLTHQGQGAATASAAA